MSSSDAPSEPSVDLKVDFNNQESDIQETNIHNSTSQQSDIKKSNKQESNTPESNNQESNTPESNNKDSNTLESNNQESNTPESNNKDSNTLESNNQESNTPESNNQESNTPESNNKDSNTPESNNKDSNTLESNNQESNTPESNNQESNTPESNNQELKLKENDSHTKDSNAPSLETVVNRINNQEACTVFVGNIPYPTHWMLIKDFFSDQFGPVMYVKFIKNVATGKFFGAAFVQFSEAESAEKAKSELMTDGINYNGRILRGGPARLNALPKPWKRRIGWPLVGFNQGPPRRCKCFPFRCMNEDCLKKDDEVSLKKPKLEKDEKPWGDLGPADNNDECSVFVGNLPVGSHWKNVRECLSQFGPIRYVVMMKHTDTKRFAGCAFARFYKAEFAEKARAELMAEKVEFLGRTLRGGHATSNKGNHKRNKRGRLSEESKVNLEEESKVSIEEESKVNLEDESKVSLEEELKVSSEEESKVSLEEETKVTSEEESKVCSEEETKVTSEEESKVCSEEETKVTSEEESKVNLGEESNVTLEDISKVILSEEPEDDSKRCSSFDCLNDDCLTQILTYVDPAERLKMEKVSRTWRRCAIRASSSQRHLLIRNQTGRLCGTQEPEPHLCRLISRNGCNLVSLDLSLVPSKVNKSTVETIGSCCRKLERLDIRGAFISNVGITLIVQKCNRLKWLNVGGCARITEKGFRSIFKQCKQLESLLCNGNRLSGNCFKVAPGCLKEIGLRHCHIQSDNGILPLLERCKNLRTVNLNNCKVTSLSGLADIFKVCHELQDVNIGHVYNRQMSETGQSLLEHPIQSLLNPTALTRLMVDNSNLTNRDLLSLCHTCVNLNELDISCNFLDDESITQLSSLEHLQYLDICHVYNITNAALTDLVTRGKLRRLRMQGCRQITDELFEPMAVSCTRLEELDIAGLVHVSPRTLLAFSKNLDGQSDRSLALYAFNNAFLDEENKWPACSANISVRVVYRRLYTSHDRWVLEGGGEPHNIVLNRWWDQLSSPEEEEDDEEEYLSPSTSMNKLNLAEAENETENSGTNRAKENEDQGSTGPCPEGIAFDDYDTKVQPVQASHVESARQERTSVDCLPADLMDDWDDADYFCNDGDYDDEFLVNDDALEAERWNLS